MNNPGARAISFLRTPVATLAVLVTALIAQLPHAADVFRLAVAGNGLAATLHSYSYAVALELAVLLFVVQRRNIESYIFAVASICMNLAYYALHGINLISVAAAPAWLISVALPVAIALYSHLIVGATHEEMLQTVAPSVEKVANVDAVQRARVQVHAQSDIPETSARAQALQMHTEGFTVAEIAHKLNAKTSTVRSWLRRKQGSAS
jgi:hypothetical protein